MHRIDCFAGGGTEENRLLSCVCVCACVFCAIWSPVKMRCLTLCVSRPYGHCSYVLFPSTWLLAAPLPSGPIEMLPGLWTDWYRWCGRDPVWIRTPGRWWTAAKLSAGQRKPSPDKIRTRNPSNVTEDSVRICGSILTGFTWFSSVSPAKFRDSALKYVTALSSQIYLEPS
jgi:hypothetical protein